MNNSTSITVLIFPAIIPQFLFKYDFAGGSDGQESAYSAGDPGSVLDQEDPLEKGMATDFSILSWRIPWTEEPWAWWATVHGFTKSRTQLSD